MVLAWLPNKTLANSTIIFMSEDTEELAGEYHPSVRSSFKRAETYLCAGCFFHPSLFHSCSGFPFLESDVFSHGTHAALFSTCIFLLILSMCAYELSSDVFHLRPPDTQGLASVSARCLRSHAELLGLPMNKPP